MSGKDPFLELQAALERDLAATGFHPDAEPPNVEPKITDRLSGKSEEQLKDLYDDLLNFYDYLTDQITRCVLRCDTSKARAVYVRARTAQEANKLPNADARKNSVETDADVVEATCDYLYYKQLGDALEERRKKISKSIDRITRELFLRNSRYGGAPTSFSSSRGQPPHKFPQGEARKKMFSFTDEEE